MPLMILDQVNHLELNEKINSTCNIEFDINEDKYNLKIYIGKLNHIIIEFNSMKFKCINKDIFDYLIKYFIEYIFDKNNAEINHRIEWDGYYPDNDENFNKLLINVTLKDKLVFRHFFNINDDNYNNIIKNIQECLLPLYYITI